MSTFDINDDQIWSFLKNSSLEFLASSFEFFLTYLKLELLRYIAN